MVLLNMREGFLFFFLLLLFLATKAERQPSLRLACRCCVGWGEKKGQLLNNSKNLKGCPRRRMKDSKEIQGNIFKGFDPGNLIVSSACNRNYFFRVAYLLWWRQLQLHRAPAGPAMSGVCPAEMYLGHFKGGVFFYAHPQPNVHLQR